VTGVCFIDTETTGLDPDRHEIWEVAIILPDGGEWDWQLPVDLSRADPIALNIGGFHQRRWQSACRTDEQGFAKGNRTSLVDFASDFANMTRGLHLAGAVVSFDSERLWKLLRKNGECPMWHYHIVDVEALAAGYISAKSEGEGWDGTKGTIRVERPDHTVNNIDGRPPWKSNDLSLAVGVDPGDFDRHTALGDARWAKAVYEAVMGR
jgi:hypothetical protein